MRVHHQHADKGQTRSLHSILSSVLNLPVLLSVLFVVQFVPFEHLSCFFNDKPVAVIDCHGQMDNSIHFVPVEEAGSMSCCPGRMAARRHEDPSGIKPCCSVDREQSSTVIVKHDADPHAAEVAQLPGASLFGPEGRSWTGPPVAPDYGVVSLHVLNEAFLI